MADEERIEAYLSGLDAGQRGVVESLMALVRAASPQAALAFKWAQPVYELDGPVCWIKAHKAHVTLGFWRGQQLPSRAGVIEGSGEKMGHLKLRSVTDLRPALIRRLVREAVALNRERGDPTRTP